MSSFIDFTGRIAIVTGAGSGIGRAAALQIAGLGGSVVVADLNGDGAEATVQEIEAAGGQAKAVVGDLSQQEVVDRVVATATGWTGRLDVLVANAGIADSLAATGDLTDEEWERLIRINLTAPFLLVRASLAPMVEQGAGSIVLTASEAGLRGSASGTAYTVSKHGVVGLTLSTAVMYREAGIRVNAIAPGATRTGMVGDPEAVLSAPPTRGLTTVASYQRNMGGMAEADQVAGAITFLASDAASNVTGTVLPVDGGWSAV
jgi:NAD(P)-dependent dehydrogenase (short-subunit alcohol dehydrogenase family)